MICHMSKRYVFPHFAFCRFLRLLTFARFFVLGTAAEKVQKYVFLRCPFRRKCKNTVSVKKPFMGKSLLTDLPHREIKLKMIFGRRRGARY